MVMTDASSNAHGPLKPTLASKRAPRTPLTPRIAGNAPASAISTKSEPLRLTPRLKQEESSLTDALTTGNVTPRSSARNSRADSSQSTPTRADETPSLSRPRTTIGGETGGAIKTAPCNVRSSRASSVASNKGSVRGPSPPLVRSSGRLDLHQADEDGGTDSRFFHASDVTKQEAPPKKVANRKTPTFFYADGKLENGKRTSPRSTSPVLSAVSEKRFSASRIRPDTASNPSRSPPMLSPALSSVSTNSPFFTAAVGHQKPRSPSPSKENIHLSYRKGASQIIGTRPPPRGTDGSSNLQSLTEERRSSLSSAFTPHRKSPSLSSIDSGHSTQSRRRSATHIDTTPTPSPLNHEVKSATIPRMTKQAPSIDTALTSEASSATESMLSPTKSVSELAADARRERKVLDLEISNSSLLAINSSLEREVRRQKAELKRFRRLSRAGRFSFHASGRSARFSEGLSVHGEDEIEDGDYAAFGPPSGFTDVYDDFSDDDESESTASGAPLSPTASANRESDRLVKDERRLRVDLEKHKELLVQSQMMNQSLKRCTYATEQMIRDGNRALVYRVKVSDVKLGGRILSDRNEDELDEVDFEEDTHSEGGDRDSGIEVEKPAGMPSAEDEGAMEDSGRPPDGVAT
ncbi:hypothetical protein BAUCODRAFT_111447 [Baudoinia panamericana UAMH 10762]|uniref:Uncharacterized protein n=1 Tax=Baudoinia panamericana (strain UAMH 10762) TaxID=717646 RepID=M2N6W7_BAUPA|nr:uncharacterized protein BAUCODRAFT_111447 [Baudoinia panamericana UAMH 10762]EMC94510.1 hypothetical protein BAUCODRAFT_111447 [Baudoinia panamericana UAMH 10762]